jgi:hypothetical protein
MTVWLQVAAAGLWRKFWLVMLKQHVVVKGWLPGPPRVYLS